MELTNRFEERLKGVAIAEFMQLLHVHGNAVRQLEEEVAAAEAERLAQEERDRIELEEGLLIELQIENQQFMGGWA